jgi:hypothetical protein
MLIHVTSCGKNVHEVHEETPGGIILLEIIVLCPFVPFVEKN